MGVQAERRYEKESVCSGGERPRDFVLTQGLEGVNMCMCVRQTTGSRQRRAA